jgi:hypothetical protein
MAAPFNPLVDGEFYIDNDNGDFWLREHSAWDWKGRLFRQTVVGLISAGPFPFNDAQLFELATGATRVHYSDALSLASSSVTCEYPTAASCDVVFTDNLAGYLSSGSPADAICVASFTGVAQVATLSFTDRFVDPFSPVWVVMPAVADLAMAGLRAVFAGRSA